MLNQLKCNVGARKKSKCVGRGISSGKGKTCGRGGKGQTARSGVSLAGFEGGQTPLYRRLPKRGFSKNKKNTLKTINFYQINYLIENKKLTHKIKIEDFENLGILNIQREKIKLLAKGEVVEKFSVEVNSASKKSIEIAKINGVKVTLV